MKKAEYAKQIELYVDSNRPIIYINHFDFKVIDELLESIGHNVKFLEYNNAFGMINFKGKSPVNEDCTLEEFLKEAYDAGYILDNDDNKKSYDSVFIILKDVHSHFDNCKVISYLKRIAENHMYNDEFSATVFIVSDNLVIPKELENYITVLDMPLPADDEIRKIIDDFSDEYDLDFSEDTAAEITLSFKGMNEFYIRQILNLAYQQDCFNNNTEANNLILKEKEQLIKKSGLLELIPFNERIENIGGLENLKNWLRHKAKVFKNFDKAIDFGVDIPKGIMIIGMPGCGKSMTSKAAAQLFNIPLVRLDIGRLLGKYVGESEENMRKAFNLAEAASPCVLWIDEIEKAFSGIGSVSSNEVTTRLFGQFLTWLQEKENTVFVVATANDISGLPPEFLRKGRFDEIFFVDLPNTDEREKIFEIHLKKRDKMNSSINLSELSEKTKGFNGADIEAVVKETIENIFVKNIDTAKPSITTEDLIKVINNTKPITSVLGDKIEKIREKTKKCDIRKASRSEKSTAKKSQ